MSRIDELIAEFCPDGVPHVRLGDVAAYSKTRISASAVDGETFVGVDNLQPNQGGRTSSNYVPKSGYLTEYRAGDVLIGNIRPYLKKIWLATNSGGCSGDVLAVRIRDSYSTTLEPEFLYRILSSEAFFAYDMQHAKGAKMPRGSKPMILKYRIPVPPLEVQREIVRILDLFTTLEAELEAELEARRRQYAHYRDTLLTFPDGGVRWAPMGEVGEFIRGRRFVKTDFVDEGIPAIHYGEIYTTYGAAACEAVTHVRQDLAAQLRYAKTGDVVIAAVGETVEDVGKAVAWLGEEDAAVHDDCFAYRHPMNPKYVSYYLQTETFHSQKSKYVARAKVKRLSAADLAKITIPIPPLEEQARIVAILDSFDALVNDLSVGLPAELAARRKQYEYYRDRLLTFKEAAA